MQIQHSSSMNPAQRLEALRALQDQGPLHLAVANVTQKAAVIERPSGDFLLQVTYQEDLIRVSTSESVLFSRDGAFIRGSRVIHSAQQSGIGGREPVAESFESLTSLAADSLLKHLRHLSSRTVFGSASREQVVDLAVPEGRQEWLKWYGRP